MVADAYAFSILFIRSVALRLCEQRLNEAVQNRLHTAVALRARQSTHLRQVVVFSFKQREDEAFDQAGYIADIAANSTKIDKAVCNAEIQLAGAKNITDNTCIVFQNLKQFINNRQLCGIFTRHARLPAFQINITDNTDHPFQTGNQAIVQNRLHIVYRSAQCIN